MLGVAFEAEVEAEVEVEVKVAFEVETEVEAEVEVEGWSDVPTLVQTYQVNFVLSRKDQHSIYFVLKNWHKISLPGCTSDTLGSISPSKPINFLIAAWLCMP